MRKCVVLIPCKPIVGFEKLLTFLNTGWKTAMWKLMTTKHRRRSISFICAAETLLYGACLEKMTVLVSNVLPPTWKEFLCLWSRQSILVVLSQWFLMKSRCQAISVQTWSVPSTAQLHQRILSCNDSLYSLRSQKRLLANTRPGAGRQAFLCVGFLLIWRTRGLNSFCALCQ